MIFKEVDQLYRKWVIANCRQQRKRNWTISSSRLKVSANKERATSRYSRNWSQRLKRWQNGSHELRDRSKSTSLSWVYRRIKNKIAFPHLRLEWNPGRSTSLTSDIKIFFSKISIIHIFVGPACSFFHLFLFPLFAYWLISLFDNWHLVFSYFYVIFGRIFF